MEVELINQSKKGILLGSGVSFKYINNDILEKEINNSISIAANFNQYFKRLEPNYLIFFDGHIWNEYWLELIRMKKTIKYLPENLSIEKQVKNYRNFHFFKRGDYNTLVPESFSSGISLNNNTGVVGLRILYLMNVETIYLVGIDLNSDHIRETNQTHFHDEYSEERTNLTNVKRYDSFLRVFQNTILEMKRRRPEINIYSCSKISRLNDIIEYNNIFDFERREIPK